MEKTWKCTVAGILNIIAGVLSLIGFIGVVVAISVVGSPLVWRFAPEVLPSMLGIVQVFLIIMAVFTAVASVLPFLSGIYALKRKRWGLALAGSVAAIFGIAPLGIASTIFTALSSEEFE